MKLPKIFLTGLLVRFLCNFVKFIAQQYKPLQIDFTHPFSRRLSYSMRLEALVIPCEVSRAHIFSFTKNKLLPVSPDKVQPCSVCHRKFFFPKKDMEICTIDAVVSDFSSVRALTNTAFLVGKSCLTCTRTHSLQLENKS